MAALGVIGGGKKTFPTASTYWDDWDPPSRHVSCTRWGTHVRPAWPGKYIIIMATICMPLADGFEDSEFTIPRERLAAAGHTVVVVGVTRGARVEGKQGKESVQIDLAVADARADDFDAMVIPGGYSPDHLRTDPQMVDFVRQFGQTKRLIAAVCHGPQLLIEADLVSGRKMTSWPSVRKDLENAGVHWVDSKVCVDGNFVTSRKPEDLEAFSEAVLNRLDQAA